MMQLSRAEALTCALIFVGLAIAVLVLWARVRAARPAGPLEIGAWRLGLSQAVSGYSFWILLGVSGAAYQLGGGAIWIATGVLVAALLNAWYVAPRLRASALRLDAGGAGMIVLVISWIAIVAQLRVAGSLLAAALDTATWTGVVYVALPALLPALIAERRAAVDTAVIGALIVLPLAVLPAATAYFVASSIGTFESALVASDAETTGVLGSASGRFLALLGSCAAGFALLGQPAVLSQVHSARTPATARRAGFVAFAWFALVLGAMLLLGWSARVLYASSVDEPEFVLTDAVARLLPPAMQALPLVAIALVVTATVNHQLLALRELTAAALDAQRSRYLVPAAAVLATMLAASTDFGSVRVYTLALMSLGVAVAPVLLVRLAGIELRPATGAIAVRIGLISLVLLVLVRNPLANSVAVLVSFLLALAVAFAGRKRTLLS